MLSIMKLFCFGVLRFSLIRKFVLALYMLDQFSCENDIMLYGWMESILSSEQVTRVTFIPL